MTLYRLQKSDQQEYGPFTLDQLRQLILDGQAFPRTVANAEGAAGWTQLSEFPELAEALATASRNPRKEPATSALPVAPKDSEKSPSEPAAALRKKSCLDICALAFLVLAIVSIILANNSKGSSASSIFPGLALAGMAGALVFGLAAFVAAIVDRVRFGPTRGRSVGRRVSVRGFAIGSLTLLLLAIVLPNFIKARTRPSYNPCINALRQIDGAKAQWALENKKADSDLVTISDIAPYLRGGIMPQCPANGTYSVTTVLAPPRCSIGGHTL